MKDVALTFTDRKVEKTQLEKVQSRITRKYWFGWAGGYGSSKKKN